MLMWSWLTEFSGVVLGLAWLSSAVFGLGWLSSAVLVCLVFVDWVQRCCTDVSRFLARLSSWKYHLWNQKTRPYRCSRQFCVCSQCKESGNLSAAPSRRSGMRYQITLLLTLPACCFIYDNSVSLPLSKTMWSDMQQRQWHLNQLHPDRTDGLPSTAASVSSLLCFSLCWNWLVLNISGMQAENSSGRLSGWVGWSTGGAQFRDIRVNMLWSVIRSDVRKVNSARPRTELCRSFVQNGCAYGNFQQSWQIVYVRNGI